MNTHTPTCPLSPTLRGHIYPAQGWRDGDAGAAWVQPWVGRHTEPPKRGRECTQGPRRVNLWGLGKPQTPPWFPESPHGRGVLRRPPPLPSVPSSRCPGEQGTELPGFAHLTQPLAPWDISPEKPRAGLDEAAAARLGAASPRDRARSLCRGRRTPEALGETPQWDGAAPFLAWGPASLTGTLRCGTGKHDLLVLLNPTRTSEPRR